jgi:hypothetical protein
LTTPILIDSAALPTPDTTADHAKAVDRSLAKLRPNTFALSIWLSCSSETGELKWDGYHDDLGRGLGRRTADIAREWAAAFGFTH